MNKSLVVLIAVTALTTLADFAIAQEKTQSRNPRYEKSYEHREFKSSTDGELKYGWMKPIQIKPDDKFPLVICLHGAGGSVGASGVLAKPEMREKYPAFVMVPAADRPFTWAVTDVIKRPGGPTSYPEKLPVLIEAVKSLIQSEVIDPNRVYITGQSMGGVGSWGAIAKHPEIFAQTLTEKLMTYALGRNIEYYDMPAVRKIVRDAAKDNYRFSSIIMGIVKSTPFQMSKVE